MITATIIAQDEERAIADCIESVRGFCEEILVVDGGSRDRTREVASKITRVRAGEFVMLMRDVQASAIPPSVNDGGMAVLQSSAHASFIVHAFSL